MVGWIDKINGWLGCIVKIYEKKQLDGWMETKTRRMVEMDIKNVWIDKNKQMDGWKENKTI